MTMTLSTGKNIKAAGDPLLPMSIDELYETLVHPQESLAAQIRQLQTVRFRLTMRDYFMSSPMLVVRLNMKVDRSVRHEENSLQRERASKGATHSRLRKSRG